MDLKRVRLQLTLLNGFLSALAIALLADFRVKKKVVALTDRFPLYPYLG